MTDRPDPPHLADPGDAPGRRWKLPARARRATPFVAGIAATFLAIALYGALFPPKPALTERDVANTVDRVLASQTPGPATSELVFAAIQPSLVLIRTDGAGSGAGGTGTGASPAPGKSASPDRETGGIGSGVVVNQSGAVLTALHVVSKAQAIHLTFADGTTTSATVASSEPASDIAVLTPASIPAGVVPATLGNPGAMHIGSEAYIVGNPFGLYDSMSTGVVSGLDRSFKDPESERVFTGLIQVDAAVNPGNSGGPLLDRGGNLVGIVTALINPTKEDVFIGIGLAVPIDVAGGAAGAPNY
jgi:S1-C subfamily serine protease